MCSSKSNLLNLCEKIKQVNRNVNVFLFGLIAGHLWDILCSFHLVPHFIRRVCCDENHFNSKFIPVIPQYKCTYLAKYGFTCFCFTPEDYAHRPGRFLSFFLAIFGTEALEPKSNFSYGI